MKRREAIRNSVLGAGSALAVPGILSLLQSCQEQDRLTWTPLFLDEDQARFIARMVDLWLPRTETPGALDVNVDVFMDLIFAKVYDEGGKKYVVDEIEKFNAECQNQFGKTFTKLAENDCIAAMKQAEQSSGKFNPGVWGTTVGEQEPIGFYRSLKSMAIWAYYSSEKIGKEVLNYDPIPGQYQGCVPLNEVGKSWSL